MAAKTPGIRGRILVVDDEAFILEVIVGMLGGQHEILAVDSGRAAKEILETDTRFDLILCDLMMPEVSGIDLHAWLVDHQPKLARQLVFMTGGVFTQRTNEYLEGVANLLFKKPFDRASLSKLVGEQLIAARSER
jgi:CheY-like chemotaxis protein